AIAAAHARAARRRAAAEAGVIARPHTAARTARAAPVGGRLVARGIHAPRPGVVLVIRARTRLGDVVVWLPQPTAAELAARAAVRIRATLAAAGQVRVAHPGLGGTAGAHPRGPHPRAVRRERLLGVLAPGHRQAGKEHPR